MGRATFILEGDEAKLVASYLKVVRSQKKVERGFDRMGRKGKQAGTSFQRMSKSMTRNLGGMVAGWVGVGAVIGGVSRGLQIVLADMKRIDEQNKKTVLSLTERIAGAGDMAQGARIRKFLTRGLKGTGVGPAEGGEIYGAIRGAAPGMELTRILKLTRASAGMKKAGFLGENLTGFATMSGEIAKLAPQKSVGDVMDLTTYVKQMEGRYGKQVIRTGMGVSAQFVKSGAGTIEQSLGLLLASVQSGQKATGAQLIVQKLREQRQFGEPKFGESAVDKKIRAFYAASPAKRMKMITTDRDVRSGLFSTQVAAVEALLAKNPEKLGAQALKAQRENAYNRAQTQALRNKSFGEEMTVTEEEARAERAEFIRDEGRGMRGIRYRKAKMRQAGVSPMARSVLGWAAETGESLGVGGEEKGMERGLEKMRLGAQLMSDLADAAEKQNKAADKTIDAADKLSDAARRTANVNAHVEPSGYTGSW